MLSAKSDLVVIGGGPSGLGAAITAARSGLKVTLLERNAQLGGRPTGFGCKATDSCNKCSVCAVFEARDQVLDDSRVDVVVNANVHTIAKVNGAYVIETQGSDHESSFTAKSIVLATGFNPFDASLRPELGWTRYPGVLTTLELDEMILGERLPKEWHSAWSGKVAFIQCVGSRDSRLGNEYCSTVCCLVSLRIARVLKYRYPTASVKVFYMDFQGVGKSPTCLSKDAIEREGIEFCQAMPSKIYPINDRLKLRYEDALGPKCTEEEFDLVVLAVGMSSPEHRFDICPTDAHGFYIASNAKAAKEGVFAAGAATGPKSIAASIRDGQDVARRAVQYVNRVYGGATDG